MKKVTIWFFRIASVVVLVFSLWFFPRSVQAALSITGVQPDRVINTSSVELLVTGSDFADGAKVIVENVGALTTSYISPTVLSALLPPGLSPGIYSITVVNPDSTSATLQNALTVTAAETTPEPQPTEASSAQRPLIVIDSYSVDLGTVSVGEQANLQVRLRNKGQQMAFNAILSFTPGEFIPLKTGGVVSVVEINPGETRKATQPFTLSSEVQGKRFVAVVMTVNYTDQSGNPYSETFTLNIPVKAPLYTGPAATATPTPTATVVPNLRPQIVITKYSTEPTQLQPGLNFYLTILIENVGKSTAQRASMILGGGSSSGGNAGQGTPDVGGVSGGSSNLQNFAPLASSNVQFIGDLPAGGTLGIQILLIVNTTTQPGAYPLPISFTYVSETGGSFTDDQVITLLVYNPPNVEVNFYRDPGPLVAGQPNQLPIQVVNLGRQSIVLGSMTVKAPNSTLENNTTLIGPLDPGGYYTLDAVLIPELPGPMEISIDINYNDDFNQPAVLTDTIPIEVQEAPVLEPLPPEGGIEEGEMVNGEGQPETFWQKVLRFLRGLFGLDSGLPTPEPPPVESPPVEEQPIPMPVRGPKG